MIISGMVLYLMVKIISDMILCVLLNYHISCPFSAAQIRFPAVPDPRILRCRPPARFHRMWCPAPLNWHCMLCFFPCSRASHQRQKRSLRLFTDRDSLPENPESDKNRIMEKQLSCNLAWLLHCRLLLPWSLFRSVIDEDVNNSRITIFCCRRHVIA